MYPQVNIKIIKQIIKNLIIVFEKKKLNKPDETLKNFIVYFYGNIPASSYSFDNSKYAY